MTRIYTRTGDKGTTAIVTGHRLSKHEPLIHVLGNLDECNASIGLALSLLPPHMSIATQLIEIQQALFDLGAHIASSNISKERFNEGAVQKLEQWIDQMEATLTPLSTFILPGGNSSAATLHLARCICRRAERHMAEIAQTEAIPFLNRLSDYLFVAARFINASVEVPEPQWIHPQNNT